MACTWDTQHKVSVEEQHKLQSEKVALIDTVKKLNREVSKLEMFKKNLLQHLNEDEEVRGAVQGHRRCGGMLWLACWVSAPPRARAGVLRPPT